MFSWHRYLAVLSCTAWLLCSCEQYHSLDAPGMDAEASEPLEPDFDAGVDSRPDLVPSPPDTGLPLFPPGFAPMELGCPLDVDRDGYRRAGAEDDAGLPFGCERTEPGDCDDATPKIDPESPELCNATDDDCDGRFDEELTCSVKVEFAVRTPISNDFTVASDVAGVVYRYRADMRLLERLDASDSPVWSTPVPKASNRIRLAVDSARGAVYLASLYADATDKPTIVVRYDIESGNAVWERELEVSSNPTSIAVDAAGDVHVSGQELQSAGDPRYRVGLLAQLAAADGAVLKLESPSNIDVMGIAAAPDGSLAMVGTYDDITQPATMLGPCLIPEASIESFVAYVEADGSCGWVLVGDQQNGNGSSPDLTHTAFLDDGAIVVAGAAYSQYRLAGVDLVDPRSVTMFGAGPVIKQTGDEVLVAVIERDGTLRWFRRVPRPGPWDEVRALQLVDSEVILGLKLAYYETFNPGYVSEQTAEFGMLMAFDGSTGQPTWSRDLDRDRPQTTEDISSIARAADGSLRVAATGDMLRVRLPAK